MRGVTSPVIDDRWTREITRIRERRMMSLTAELTSLSHRRIDAMYMCVACVLLMLTSPSNVQWLADNTVRTESVALRDDL